MDVTLDDSSSYPLDEDEVPDPNLDISKRRDKKWKRISHLDSDSDDHENEGSNKKKRLIGRKVSRQRNKYGETPMHIACKKGDLDGVKKLVEEGYSLHQKDDAGWYPLHETSNYEVVDFLLNHGAKTDVRSAKIDGWLTPLMDAAKYGQLHIMQLLIDRGADCSLKDSEGRTALGILTAWRQENPVLNGEFLTAYNNIVKSLTETRVDEVVLLIPSMLEVPDKELEAIYRELGITSEQSVVWPPTDKRSSLKVDDLPHIMLDVVEVIRTDDVDKLAAILSDVNPKKYEYLQFHCGQNDNVTQNVFSKITEILGALNSEQQNVGRLLSGKSERMKILALYLSAKQPAYKDVITCLLNPIFEWSDATSMRSMVGKPRNNEEEHRKLWKWLMSRVRPGFQIVTCPERKSTFPEHQLLRSEKFSSEVTGKLLANFSDLQKRVSFKNADSVTVMAIDGANRDVLKYKAFVREIIENEKFKSEEIFYIISIEETDDIALISDILPPQLVEKARAYSAFSPEEVCLSCVVIHIMQKEAALSPNTSERKGPKASVVRSSSPSVSDVVEPSASTSRG